MPSRPLSRSLASRPLGAALAALLVCAGPARLAAQQPTGAQAVPPLDSLVVEGNHRLTATQILGTAGLVVGQTVGYRDIQRALTALFRTGQFDDATIEQREGPNGELVIAIVVRERPVLQRWVLRGVEKVGERQVKDRVQVPIGRAVDRAAVARSVSSIDSLYREKGYYRARVRALELPQPDGQIRVVFDVEEGNRVALSQVAIDGNDRLREDRLVGRMHTRPEGFWWFRSGEIDDDELERDLRERLPEYYADRGFIDFQVTGDSLEVDSTTGKAALRLTVDEGAEYRVGKFEVLGNRRFSTEELMTLYPFAGDSLHPDSAARPFDRSAWDAATRQVQTLYGNNGYIYANVQAQETRRTLPDGTHLLDLTWQIQEGQPATIRRIDILGNDVTHERVIREAILLVPGELFNQDRFIRSYQNIANLGFFEQPMPEPQVEPIDGGPDVNLTFHVTEKRTGNINFGASIGQGTGVGGFLGLEEPNLFGRAKRGRFQWQFGRNVNDFTLSYTDPAFRDTRVSTTISLYNSRQRFTVGDLGRRRTRGGSLQVGFPLMGSRYTRLFFSYGLQSQTFTGGSSDLQSRFNCNNCTRSTLGVNLVRDTRIGLPFPTDGAYISVGGEQNGGILQGTGNYQKVDLESRFYTPLGTSGGTGGPFGGGIQYVLGLTARSGFVFGDASQFPTDLYSVGGVQFGIPLRGYEEFSITPDGFNAQSGSTTATANSFGRAYASFTLEAGARISQSVYVNTFLDAANLYREPRQYDPTRLFRGAGFGASFISPLGPLGLDLAYGFDRKGVDGRPNPGWKLHFRLGNFF
ncbi:MAG TPA: outer membrane protein assembly factor BamA [Gemmatimonadales bacterium]|nr:outer membrane protein assembly factor BamA [Gemmatimonadales bacterium]